MLLNRAESVEQFLAEEIQIEDLTETQLVTPMLYEKTKYPLIAELPEADIFLYGQPNGAVIKYGENITVLNWNYMTPRFVLPTLAQSDVNRDGTREIICILDAGSGTGVSVEELHALELIEGKYRDPVFADYKVE